MPRERVDQPEKIAYLSILDEKGQLDSDLEPEMRPRC